MKCISRYSQVLGHLIMCSLPARHSGRHVGGYSTPLGSEILSWVGGMCGSQNQTETCALIYGHDGNHANTLAAGLVPGKVTWR